MAGGLPSQRSSISRSRDTGSPACRSRIARSARGFAASGATTRPSATASSGPSMRKSIETRAERSTPWPPRLGDRYTGTPPALYRPWSAGAEGRRHRKSRHRRQGGIEMTTSTAPATGRPRVGRAAPTTATRNRRFSYLLIAATVVALPAWLLTRTEPRLATQLEFTGSPQTYAVPSGICRLRVDVIGGAGGRGATIGAPGAGVQAVAVIAVTPEETLHVYVGGWGGDAVGPTPGSGGWNGGGEGGKAFGTRRRSWEGGGRRWRGDRHPPRRSRARTPDRRRRRRRWSGRWRDRRRARYGRRQRRRAQWRRRLCRPRNCEPGHRRRRRKPDDRR